MWKKSLSCQAQLFAPHFSIWLKVDEQSTPIHLIQTIHGFITLYHIPFPSWTCAQFSSYLEAFLCFLLRDAGRSCLTDPVTQDHFCPTTRPRPVFASSTSETKHTSPTHALVKILVKIVWICMHAHICRSPEHQHGLPVHQIPQPTPRTPSHCMVQLVVCWWIYTHPQPTTGWGRFRWLAPTAARTRHRLWFTPSASGEPQTCLCPHTWFWGHTLFPPQWWDAETPPPLQQLGPRVHWLQQLPAQPEVPTAWTNSRGWHPVPHAH